MAPASIQHLFEAGEIASWRFEEALALWQGARRDVRASEDPEAAERLYVLAIALSVTYQNQNDASRQRAVLESSLEVLRLPRHRQCLRCHLARAACFAGDVAAAQKWVAPCDAASDDIEMDTAYRLARAVIATTRRDWPSVLQVLTNEPTAVPVFRGNGDLFTVLRANAIEQLGDVDVAARQLSSYMSQGADESKQISVILAANTTFCVKSRLNARASGNSLQAEGAFNLAGGSAGYQWLVIGGVMGVVGVVLLIAVLAIKSSSQLVWPFLMPGGILLVMGLMFLRFGLPLYRAGERARRLVVMGELADAVVLAGGRTGFAINNTPQYAYTLRVQRALGQPAYEVQVKVVGRVSVEPGATVAVFVDSNDSTGVTFSPS